MTRQNQSIAFTKSQVSPPASSIKLLVPLLMGLLTFAARGNVLIAQTVVERLPPPSQTVEVEQKQLSSPSNSIREFDFQAPLPNQPSPSSASYLVYVDETSSTRLRQIQRLEPTAFVRQYNGQAVIQAGIFSQKSNAQQRVRELNSWGIGARLVSLATGEDKNFVNRSKSYFVVIPDSQEKLSSIANKVRKLPINLPVIISQKEQPRGPHVRVGPFPEFKQAQSWSHKLQDVGLKDARVFYGR